MLEHGAAVVGLPRFGENGVVHDGEGDVVDHVVGHFLSGGFSKGAPGWLRRGNGGKAKNQ